MGQVDVDGAGPAGKRGYAMADLHGPCWLAGFQVSLRNSPRDPMASCCHAACNHAWCPKAMPLAPGVDPSTMPLSAPPTGTSTRTTLMGSGQCCPVPACQLVLDSLAGPLVGQSGAHVPSFLTSSSARHQLVSTACLQGPRCVSCIISMGLSRSATFSLQLQRRCTSTVPYCTVQQGRRQDVQNKHPAGPAIHVPE